MPFQTGQNKNMKPSKIFSILLLLSIATNSIAQSQEKYQSPFHFQIEKIQEGIYFAYRAEPLRYLVEGNSTIIINEDNVLVIDATGSPQGARQIIEEIKKMTAKPVKFLINTHGHGDHTIGNTEFVKAFPEITIISHPETRNYLTAKEGGINYFKDIAKSTDSRVEYINSEIKKVTEEAYPGYEAVVKNLEQYRDHDLQIRQKTYQTATITPPNLTFENKMVLNMGKREVQLIHLGDGDTPGDIWVYLPNEKILCSGDAIVHPIPYGFSKHGIEWLETLKKAAGINFEILIPGHGQIQKGKEYLNLYISLLEEVADQIEKSIIAGFNKEETIKKIDISAIEKKFTNGETLNRYYFDAYFKKPHFDRVFDLIKIKLEKNK